VLRVPARRVLVFYWHPVSLPIRAAISHHLRVLDRAPEPHEVLYFNTFRGVPAWLRYLRPDAIILHTTLLCLRWTHLFEWIRKELRWIAELRCARLAVPQDEYDHAELLDEWLAEMRVTDVFSIFEGAKRDLVYPQLRGRARFHKCFTGYIDESTARRVAARLLEGTERRYGVVYRATHLPYWFGSHGQLKHRIAGVIDERAHAHSVRTDISTRVEDTILGDPWFDFLMSGRTVLGCESGSSVLDRRGEIQSEIRQRLESNPGLGFEDIDRTMPDGWDRYQFFALSPRHFEAVITKTCQVLVEGEYEGVLKSGRHYISLRRDFANVDQVLDHVQDSDMTRHIAETAYEEIYLGGAYGYAAFAAQITRVLEQHETTGTWLRRLWPGALVLPLARTAAIRSELPDTSLPEASRPPKPPLGPAPPPPEALAGLGKVSSLLLRLVEQLEGWSVLARLRLAPMQASAKGLRMCWFLLQDARLCRIVLAWAARVPIRSSIPLDQMLADILRLGMLRRTMAHGGGGGFVVRAYYDPKRNELRFQSEQSDAGLAPAPALEISRWRLRKGPIGAIVWDHSPVGVWLHGIQLGPSGVYRFEALSRLARIEPDVVWNALQRLLDEHDQRARPCADS
jgi:hypothetical protein